MMDMTGGCACGRVRYRARVDTEKAYWCHCRMCQRAVGNVAAAFVNVARADIEWTGAAPDEWASSAIAFRGFCSHCGTPLSFRYPDSDNIDLTVGSLDAPETLRPHSHFGAESRLPGWIAEDDLPATRCDDYPSLVARWDRAAE